MIIFPDKILLPYISHYMITTLDQGQATYLSATSSPTLVCFRRGGVWLSRDNLTDELAPAAYIEGPFLMPRQSKAKANTEVISVHFRPTALGHFFTGPVSELTHHSVPLDNLESATLALLTDEIIATNCAAEAITRIESRLIELLVRQRLSKKMSPKPFKLPPDLLHRPVKLIAERIGIGTRQFERRFLANYGVTLRDWRRLDRAGRALMSLLLSSDQVDITTIASSADYFDHSHMCRDFRQLCGVSPQEFIGRAASDPAYWPFRELIKLTEATCRIDTSATGIFKAK